MRRSPLSCALTTVLMVSIGPVPMVARAQAAPQTSDAPPASNPSAATSDDERVARELFEQGRDAYTEGRFEDARELFERSYERSGRPELLYNIAQAAERTRDDEHALETYRAFLEALPDAVVWPETVHEVSRLLRWASEGKVPVVTYGGGTSLRAATMPSTSAMKAGSIA